MEMQKMRLNTRQGGIFSTGKDFFSSNLKKMPVEKLFNFHKTKEKNPKKMKIKN
jgi:hypothetical protein